MATIRIDRLPPNSTRQYVENLCKPFGAVTRVDLDAGSNSAVVEFKSDASADQAVQRLKTFKVTGGALSARRVRSSFSTVPQPSAPTHRRTTSSISIPYGFAPLDVTRALHAQPVFHDGRSPEHLVSGELRCELTALTPLLVANDSIEFVSASADIQTTIRTRAGGGDPKPTKKILEPLRLRDGRVVLSGAAVKGMLRLSIGALTQAPMERVAERTYSYRPNLNFGAGAPKLEPRPAIVETSPTASGSGLTVRVYDRARPTSFDGPGGAGLRSYPYVGGLAGLIVRLGPPLHRSLQIDPSRLGAPVAVDPDVVLHWWRTLDHLADRDVGHISSRHPTVGARRDAVVTGLSGLRTALLRPGNALYVEYDAAANAIVSMGNHFHYRWRYRDSVRMKNGAPRPMLTPTAAELAPTGSDDEHHPPSALTGARLLFGYTDDSEGSAGIGRGNFSQLAGRVAINMPIEVLGGRSEPERFQNQSSDYLVSLKPLGQPRPSAVEHYLDQPAVGARSDAGTMLTYGDLGPPATIDPSGELRGRKFYWHQPDAARDVSCYEDNAPENWRTDQSSLGRFVSTPETRFRFRVRFQDLRPWELGLVALALCPNAWRQLLVEKLGRSAPEWLHSESAATSPALAVKLGHGRPLGLGSARIDPVELRVWNDGTLASTADCRADTQSYVEKALDELHRQSPGWQGDTLLPWLRLMRYNGRTRCQYPSDGTIFRYHLNARRRHAAGRRSAGTPNPDPAIPNFTD